MALDLDRVRVILLEDQRETSRRRENLTRQLDDVMAAASDVATDDEHDPEGATIAYERARTAALVGQAEQHLVDIRLALGRLDAGTYATCERCSNAIAEARLDARPIARTCLDCASRAGPRYRRDTLKG